MRLESSYEALRAAAEESVAELSLMRRRLQRALPTLV
jgi:hypothetical protein